MGFVVRRGVEVSGGRGEDVVELVDAAVEGLALDGSSVVGPATFDMHEVEESRAEGELGEHADGEAIGRRGRGNVRRL